MIREDRVILMTKLARFEKKENSKALASSKYYRSDYISIKMIETLFTTTIAYMLLVVLGVLYNVDYLSEHIVTMDLLAVGKKLLIGYVIFLAVFMIISYIVYSIRYHHLKKDLNQYSENLKTLYLMYKKDMKVKEEGRAGGHRYDETTGV